MHHYRRNIGDYAKKAGKLSMLQDGAYNRLIDCCYDREQFPTRDQAIDWSWASTSEEVEAVEFILRKFFILQPDGTYVQNRILEELQEYWMFCSEQSEKGKKGGRPKKAVGIEKKPDGFSQKAGGKPVESQRVPKKSLTTNHQPLTTNQTVKTCVADAPPTKRFIPPSVGDVTEYVDTRPIKIDPQNFIDHYTANGWRVGRNPMKDWRAAVRTWEKRERQPVVLKSVGSSTRNTTLEHDLTDTSWAN